MRIEQLNNRAHQVNIYGLFTPQSTLTGFNRWDGSETLKEPSPRPYAPDSYVDEPARVCIFDPLQVTVSEWVNPKQKDSKSSIQKIFSKKMGSK